MFKPLLNAILLLSCLTGWAPLTVAQEEVPVIAAASDLQFAMEELTQRFQAVTGKRVRVVSGSTGNFARQIRSGAPFELFMAADESFVEGLVEAGLTRDDGVLYARGRVVLLLPSDSPIEPDDSLDGLEVALQAGTVRHFAIANPEHAPYGMRAREALRQRGLWEALQGRLVLGENVSQAAQFALSGDTAGGLVALSLAMAPAIQSRGRHVLIPEAWHQPLNQRMVLLRQAGPVAEAFYGWLQGEEARGILARYGFTPPETP